MVLILNLLSKSGISTVWGVNRRFAIQIAKWVANFAIWIADSESATPKIGGSPLSPGVHLASYQNRRGGTWTGGDPPSPGDSYQP